MQIALPELNARATLILDREDRLTDDEYFAFCVANPDLNFERTAQGEIVIVPPPGGESDYRNLSVSTSFNLWARMDGRGKAFGPTVHFLLPDGSARSPDAAWISNERLSHLSKQEKRQFLRVVPEFVVEVLSPSDRLKAAQKKLRQWAANGVELGWLIDGDARRVYVYRGDLEPRIVANADSIAGEIWEGL
jgi:Uma2 family endonuclease